VMEKRRGRPKGPEKRKVVVSLPIDTFNWLESKAGPKKETSATYLARNVVQLHQNDVKNREPHDVRTNFKGKS
jgi:hypothetical protein